MTRRVVLGELRVNSSGVVQEPRAMTVPTMPSPDVENEQVLRQLNQQHLQRTTELLRGIDATHRLLRQRRRRLRQLREEIARLIASLD